MESKIGKTFGIDAIVEDNLCCESSDVFIEVHDIDETLVGRSCRLHLFLILLTMYPKSS